MLSKYQVLLPLLATLLAPASSTFVVQCTSRLFDERADPIVNPGSAAPHVHVIVGGDGFGLDMTYDDALASKCSTCHVKEDLSNYWTPKMYFHAKNGSFIPVPIDGDNQYGARGGMAIYYNMNPGPDNDKLTAFPPGFRMLAGDSARRASSTDFAGVAVKHQCNVAGGPFIDQALPNRKCDSIRSQMVMPSCWDGKNLDGVNGDHKSHMSYPEPGPNSFFDGGRCPKSHPIHFPTLFYEVTYSTNVFANEWSGTEQPFVFSNGDATGYGFHGDFVNGWHTKALQKGIDTCVPGVDSCTEKVFTIRSGEERGSCRLPQIFDDTYTGVLAKLPGCNDVTAGPAYAKAVTSCPAPKLVGGGVAKAANPATPATSSKAAVPATSSAAAKPAASSATVAPGPTKPLAVSLSVPDLTKSKGYKFIGCGKDTQASRTLTGPMTWSPSMTIEKCVDFCKSKGATYAGLEYANQCYCGNSVAADRAPKTGVAGGCKMKCAGNAGQICGGPDALTLYQVCAGGACSNAVKKRSRRMATGHAHHARSFVGRLVEAAS